jgi:bacillolysin
MKKKRSSVSGMFNRRLVIGVALVSLGASLGWVSLAGGASRRRAAIAQRPSAKVSAATQATLPNAQDALLRLQSATRGQIATEFSAQTGYYSFVKAANGSVLASDKASAPAERRARLFLGMHGALVGLSDGERAAVASGTTPAAGSDLHVLRSDTDSIGTTHVKFDQAYKGLSVFGAQVVVHMNDRGVTAVNGNYVPQISIDTTPALTKDAAAQAALATVRKNGAQSEAKIDKSELAIYPLGLLEGRAVRPLLAYAIEVSGPETHEQVWLDANTGAVLNRISLRPDALFRMVYSPQFDPNSPNQFVIRKEGDPPVSPLPGQNSPVDNLYDFTGFAYNFYASAFGRDSFDANGAIMRTVLLINQQCPNAYWNGACTNYCPDFDKDDVVCHEWSHAYTQYTHGLVYSYQSGALNESYSDIFGETIDLIDGVDGDGGNDNANHATYDPLTGERTGGGQRFLIGEDVHGLSDPNLGILRDMYTPAAFGNPDKVSSTDYSCGSGDNGGVHNNSGVPNHAYALAVDGGTFNNQTINGIGLTKAAAIWFRAESVYQTPSTNFAQHQTAVETSCSDLVGQPIYDLKTNTSARTVSGQTITAGDCGEVHKAMLAVEMNSPIPCNFPPLLDPNTPAICDHNQSIYSENWESGTLDGWTLESVGEKNNFGVITSNPDWPNTNWQISSSLPQGHTGKAVFAIDSTGGTCQAGGDISGRFSVISPVITIPAGATNSKLKFDHFVQTETGFDGGNLLISVNGGAFNVVPQGNFIFNAPNQALNSAQDPQAANTNPKAGQQAWTGSNQLNGAGSWGTTIVDLASLAQPGDTIKLKYEFGEDGCGGALGWYVDNVVVYNCPNLPGPTLSVGGDYENPDTNGSFTLNWNRPAGAIGPDVLQVSQTSCAPIIFDNANNLSQWNATNDGIGSATWTTSSAKPQHVGNSAFWTSTSEAFFDSAYLTFKNPINIPASGITTLRFSEFYFNETGDSGSVEVSTDNGTTWTAIYTNARPMGSLPDEGANAFANEDLTPQSLDLTVYSGKTIRLRFHYFQGGTDYFFFVTYGWYIDDISITNESWTDVATTTGTSFTDHKPSGNYCYQVRTHFLLGSDLVPSLFSNVVNVTVAPGIPRVISRKTHALGGTFDVDLPLTGGPGIEPRKGTGANGNNHQVIFQFGQPVTFTGASATPGPGGTGQVSSTSGNGTREIVVNLSNVSNAQTLTLSLTGVSGAGTAANLSVPIGFLIGDTNADGSVNSGDISQVKSQSGQVLSTTNFREDLNSDGDINSGDISLVKSASGTALP